MSELDIRTPAGTVVIDENAKRSGRLDEVKGEHRTSNFQRPTSNGRKAFRLALYTPNGMDGTALVRSTGPLLEMARSSRNPKSEIRNPKFELEIVRPERDTAGRQELTWDWLASCDALMVQRPYVREHLRMMLTAKQLGLKVWVDWDDDLTCVRDSNPHKAEYSDAGLKEILTRIARNADVVTVTTVELKRRVESWIEEVDNAKGQMGKDAKVGENGGQKDGAARETARPAVGPYQKVRVVPNALHWPMAEFSRERVVSWRGGFSHDEDVLSVLPWIEEVCRMPQFSKWDWHFMGEPPWQVKQTLAGGPLAERVHVGFGADPFFYMQAFARLAPWVHIVPLADHAFNRGKSNLAWIEATAAGAVTLAPDWEEWRRPGVVNYKDPKSFAVKLRELMYEYPVGRNDEGRGTNEETGMHPNVKLSREFIRAHLMLEKVNEMRWEILEEFAG